MKPMNDKKPKIIGIHQPMFLPYVGTIKKIIDSDIFIFLDDVQFADSGFQNRNKIYTNDGIKWITVPLGKPRYKVPINEIKINYNTNWIDNMLGQLKHNYGKTPYYLEVCSMIENILRRKYELLSDLCVDMTKEIIAYLKVEKEYRLSSDIKGKSDDRIDRIIDLVHSENGDIFLSGDGAKCYMELERFTDIEIQFQNYTCKEYPQMNCDKFVPYLSIVDYLCNVGSDISYL